MKKLLFTPTTCECCKQTTQVLYALDAGSADLVKALLTCVKITGRNKIHLRSMEVSQRDYSYARMLKEGVITSAMYANSTRAHKHGLIAQVEGEHGYWAITRKGAAFLKGEPVPQYAIQNKVTKHIEGHFMPDKYRVTIFDLKRPGEPYWQAANLEINNGIVTTGTSNSTLRLDIQTQPLY